MISHDSAMTEVRVSVKALNAFRGVFPHGNFNEFMRYFLFWRGDSLPSRGEYTAVDLALWCYGEIRRGTYVKERCVLERELLGVRQ